MRSCVVCGQSLEGRRADALHCSGACRAEASRIQRILSGSMPTPYSSLAARIRAAHKRTNWACRGSETDQQTKTEEKAP
jgi:hypothetical protein